MARCSGIKRDGGRCGAQAIAGSAYCFNHDPRYEEARRRRNSKGGRTGGRGRPRREIQDVKARLLRLSDLVELGTFDPRAANTIAQILNVFLRACEVERKLEELRELEQRITALEEQQGGYTWTAKR